MSPINFKITNAENSKNGTLVIESKNVEEKKLKKQLKQKLAKMME